MKVKCGSVVLSYDKKTKRYRKSVQGELFLSSRGLTTSAEDKIEAENQFIIWKAEKLNDVPNGMQLITIPWSRSEDSAFRQMTPQQFEQWQDQQEAMGQTIHRGNGGTKLKDLIDEYIEFKKRKVSASQLVVYRSHFKFFADSIGETIDVNTLTVHRWEKFHNLILKNIDDGTWSHKYGNSVLGSVRGMFSWLEDTNRIETPPTFIRSKSYSIKIPRKKVKPFMKDEIQVIMQHAKPLHRLWYLLMLNTAMTQADLSALTPSQINLKEKTLTRIRTKHQHQDSQDIPEVKYHLWDSVVKLLKQFGDFQGDKVFTNSVGGPLVGLNRNDTVATAYKPLAKELGITKTLKHFRKSGSSCLGSHKEYRAWRELFLANTGSSITDVSYDGTEEIPKEITDYIESELEPCKLVK